MHGDGSCPDLVPGAPLERYVAGAWAGADPGEGVGATACRPARNAVPRGTAGYRATVVERSERFPSSPVEDRCHGSQARLAVRQAIRGEPPDGDTRESQTLRLAP